MCNDNNNTIMWPERSALVQVPKTYINMIWILKKNSTPDAKVDGNRNEKSYMLNIQTGDEARILRRRWGDVYNRNPTPREPNKRLRRVYRAPDGFVGRHNNKI